MSADFDDLVAADDIGEEELAELRRVHELLLSATPAPEPSRRLGRRPRPPRVRSRPRWKSARVVIALTAAALLVAFGLGYELRSGASSFRPGLTRAMHGLGATRDAVATIAIGHRDADGNVPLALAVKGLPSLADGFYQLYLTRKGEPDVLCGDFRTGKADVTHVELNAPEDLDEYSGWVVVAHVGNHDSAPLLTT